MSKFIFISIFLFFINISQACSCDYNNASLIEKYNDINNIFKGKVFSIKRIKINNENYDAVTFSVSRTYKGIENNKAVVYDASDTSCSINFNIGQDYIVWAYSWDGKLMTHLCTETKSIQKTAKDDINLLANLSESNGYKIWYDNKGNKIAEGSLINNEAEGYWKYYFYGFLHSEGLYIKSIKDGKWTKYFEGFMYPIQLNSENKEIVMDLLNGQNPFFRKISTISNYKSGKRTGEFVSYDLKGKTKAFTMYKDNQRNGASIDYGENGKPKNIYNYLNDKLDGRNISFFDNGAIELIYNCKNDLQIGDWELFDDNGKILCSSKNDSKFPAFIKGNYHCKEN